MAHTAGTYKLEFRTWNGAAYEWTDYSSRLVSFDAIQQKIEGGSLPNSFTASMGSVVVDNSDGFWATRDALLDNSAEPYGKTFRKRKVRISVEETDLQGNTSNRYLFTGSVDDIKYDNSSGKATISVISLDRIAMEQYCDADKINDNDIAGAWGAGKLYELRTKHEGDGSYNYTWYEDRNAYDILEHLATALDDAASSHEQITLTTHDSRRVISTYDRTGNISALAGHVIYGVYYSELHSMPLIITSYYDGASYHTRIYTYDKITGAVSLEYEGPDGSGECFAFWYNSSTDRVMFLQKQGPTPDYYICALADDYTLVRRQITEAGFAGNVAYNQARNSGVGSVFINTGTNQELIEYSADISSGLSELNSWATGQSMGKMAIIASGAYVAFLQVVDATRDDIWGIRLSDGVKIELLALGAGICCDALYYDNDYLFYITRNCSAWSTYKVRSMASADIAQYIDDGISTPSEADVYAASEAYRVIAGFSRGGDGLYFIEQSVFGESSANPAQPTCLLCIKDTDKTAAVYENKVDATATFGEFVVDGELGIKYSTSKAVSKYEYYYFGISYNPATDWELWGMTGSNNILFTFSKTISPFIRFCDFSGMTAWELRKKIAEMMNAVVYYDYDGTFCFKKRPTSGAAEYTIYNPVVSLTGSGYKSVKNCIYSTPYYLPIAMPAATEITPWSICKPTSDIALSKISLGAFTTNANRWRFKFTSATAYNVDEETAVGTYATRTTGTKGTSMLYAGSDISISVNGGDWTGTAAVGDEIVFWSKRPQRKLERARAVEKIEARDATSIAAYQKSESSFDNRFCHRMILADVLHSILDYWKQPHRTLTIKTEANPGFKIFTRLAFAEATMDIDTSDVWAVTSIKRSPGSPDVEMELTEI